MGRQQVSVKHVVWFVCEKGNAQHLTQSTRNALQMQHVNAEKSDTRTQYKKAVAIAWLP